MNCTIFTQSQIDHVMAFVPIAVSFIYTLPKVLVQKVYTIQYNIYDNIQSQLHSMFKQLSVSYLPAYQTTSCRSVLSHDPILVTALATTLALN